MPLLQDILGDLNGRLNAEAIIRAINYYPDKITKAPGGLKCFCPLHKENAFRSLIVDTEKNRYKCTFVKCPGYEGGNLIEFYAAVTQKDLATSAAELAQAFNITFDSDAFGDRTKDLGREAERLLSEGDAEGALRHVELALEAASNDPSLYRLQAQILEALERGDDALEAHVRAAEAYGESGDNESELELLQALHEAHPEQLGIATRYSDSLATVGRAGESLLILREACRMARHMNACADHLHLFERLAASSPDDLGALEDLASIYETAEMPEKAAEQWQRIVEARVRAEDNAGALEALEHLEALGWKPGKLRRLRASVLHATGNTHKAHEDFLELAREAAQERDYDGAADLLGKILADNANHTEALEEWANVQERAGNGAEAADALRKLARARTGNKDHAGAAAYWRRAVLLSPLEWALRESLIDSLRKGGEESAALDELLTLAREALGASETAVAEEACLRIAQLAPADANRRIEAASLLHEHGLTDKALDQYLKIVETALARDDSPAALKACDSALRASPGNAQFLEMRLRALASSSRREDALEAMRPLVESLIGAKNWKKAISTLETAREEFHADPWVLAQLAEAYEKSGKPKDAARVWGDRAEALRAGEPAIARESLLRKLSLAPNDLPTLKTLCVWLEEDGDTRGALEYVKTLAAAAEEANAGDEAIFAHEQLIALVGETLEALRGYADCLAKFRGHEAAIPVFQKVLKIVRVREPIERVKAEYEHLIELQAGNAALREEYVEWLLSQGRQDTALGELRELHRQYADVAGQTSARVAVIRRIRKLAPEDASPVFELAQAEEKEGSLDQAAEHYLEAALAFQDTKDNAKAVEAYRSRLRLAPEDETIRLALAQFLERLGDKAASGVERATLADEAMRRKDGRGAVEHIDAWRAYAEGEQSELDERLGDALRLAANQAHQKRQLREAMAFATRLMDMDPNDLQWVERMSLWCEEAGLRDKAQQLTERLVAAREKDGDIEGAEAAIRRLLALKPDGIELYRRLGDFLRKHKGVDEAMPAYMDALAMARTRGARKEIEQEYQSLIEMKPDDAHLRSEFIEFLVANGSDKRAVKELRALAETHAARGETAEHARCLERLGGLQPRDAALVEERAGVEEDAKRFDQAAQLYLEAANLCREENLHDRAVAAYEARLRLMPDDTETREALVEFLEREKRFEEAGRQRLALADAAREAKDFALECAQLEVWRDYQPKADVFPGRLIEAQLQAAEAFHREGRNDVAIERLERVLEMAPEHAEAQERIAVWNLESGDVDSAVASWQRIARTREDADDLDGAEVALREAVRLRPDSQDIMRHLAEFAQRRPGRFDAASVYRESLERSKESGEAAQVQQMFRSLLTLDPQNVELRREYLEALEAAGDKEAAAREWREVASLCQARGDAAGRAGALDRLAAMAPEDVALIEERATAAMEAGNRQDASALYLEAARQRAAQGENRLAIDNLRARLAIDAEDEEARNELAELLEAEGERETAGRERLVLAEYFRGRDDEDEEMRQLELALFLVPGAPESRERMAELCKENDRADDAAMYWKQALNHYSEKKQWDKALALAHRARESFPGSRELRETLAETLAGGGQLEQALDEWESLAIESLQARQIPEAEKLFKRMTDRAPKSVRGAEGAIRILEAKGKIGDAATQYAKMGDQRFKAGAERDALRLWDRALALNEDLIDVRRRRAERLLALAEFEPGLRESILAARWLHTHGKKRDLQKEMKVIQTHIEKASSLRAEYSSLLYEIGQAEDAIRESLASATERRSAGDYLRAQAICERAIEAGANDPRLLELYALILQDQDENEMAVVQWTALASLLLSRKEAEAAEAACRAALELQADYPEAQRMLIDALRLSKKPEDLTAALISSGENYAHAKRSKEAIASFREALAIDAGNEKALAALANSYIKEGATEDAIETLGRLVDLAVAEHQLTKAKLWLTQMLDLDSHNEAARKRRAELVAKMDSFGAALADFRYLAERAKQRTPQEAAALYDDVLRRYPDSVEFRRDYAQFLEANGEAMPAKAQWSALAKIVFERDNNVSGSIDALAKATELDPADGDAWAALAERQEKKGVQDKALESWRKAADAYVRADRFDAALAPCALVAAASPDDRALQTQYAELLKHAGRSEEAADIYESLAKIFRSENLMERAIDAYALASALSPNRLKVHQEIAYMARVAGDDARFRDESIAVARIQCDTGAHAAAIETYTVLLRAFPDDTQLLRLLTETAWQSGDRDRWRKTIKKRAQNLAAAGARQEALDIYREALAQSPGEDSLLEQYADLQRQMGDVDQAGEVAEQRAALAESAGQSERALELYREASEALASADAQGRIAEAFFRLGAPEEGVLCQMRQARLWRRADEFVKSRAAYESILERDPSHFDARRGLVDCLEAMGALPEAAESLAELSRSVREAGSPDEALALLRRAVSLEPANFVRLEEFGKILLDSQNAKSEAFEIYRRLAEWHAGRENWPGAIACAKTMLELGVDGLESRRLLARYSELGGHTTEAGQYSKTALEGLLEFGRLDEARADAIARLHDNPDDFFAKAILLEVTERNESRSGRTISRWIDLGDEASRHGDRKTAILCFERLRATREAAAQVHEKLADLYDLTGAHDKANDERFRMADYHLSHGMIEEAESWVEKAVAAAPDSRAMRTRAAELYETRRVPELAAAEYTAIADSWLAEGNDAAAEETIRKGVKLRPRDIALRRLLVDCLTRGGRNDELYAELGQLAKLAQDAELHEEAIGAERRMIELRPAETEPRRRLAWSLSELDKSEELAKCLRELATMLEERGEDEKALETMREFLAVAPEDIEIRERYIALYSKNGQEIELVGDFLALAQRYADSGMVPEATQTYERLMTLAPTLAEVRRIFVEFLATQGQTPRLVQETLELVKALRAQGSGREAIAAVEYALRSAPSDAALIQALGECFELMRMAGQAIEAYRRLGEIAEEEKNLDTRIFAMERIVALDTLDTRTRTQLIRMLRENGRSSRANEHALKLGDQYMERGFFDLAERSFRELLQDDPENVTVWQRILEAHANIGQEEDLISDYIILGDLYMRQGQVREACRMYQSVYELNADNIQMRRKYIDAYLQIGLENELLPEYLALAELLASRGEVYDSIRLYERAARIDPNNQAVKDALTKTKAWLKKSQFEAAIAETCVADPDAGPPDTVARASLNKTIENYESLLKLNPDNVQARWQLAEAYEQTGHMEDAFHQWDLASVIYIEKGQLQRGIEICDRLLRRDPDNKRIRERLTKARLKKESLRAIDSAIMNIKELK